MNGSALPVPETVIVPPLPETVVGFTVYTFPEEKPAVMGPEVVGAGLADEPPMPAVLDAGGEPTTAANVVGIIDSNSKTTLATATALEVIFLMFITPANW
jgi:hypothetical protein